ncbi:DUF1642 domain-containing protein [Streptococcus sp. F0441]|uniref:DUF1642 domain-containing protein n=1 Tax=Streptococcus sp. F0441 TaxID=999424 RepID=UPI0002992F66|nr:DUF1642 domain-containing protein [Streptococcus sp. F0441]EKS16991.1 hypothetical protein HMPREF9188_01610 [Streptococcus sp. F0441]
MNVQRLIEKYKKLEGVWDAEGAELARQIFLQDLEQLDEPEKVQIPQFVAEFIEFKKKNNFHVYGAMRTIEDHYDKKVPGWFYEGNIEKFCLAWIFGYEVEKEKRYLVKFKGFNPSYIILKYHPYDKTWFLGREQEYNFFRQHHTRKELEEAGFGWVFDCLGIEIEEVTD